MYYVAKLSTVFKPTIVEIFEDKNLAFAYATVMNMSNKGDYIVLGQIEEDFNVIDIDKDENNILLAKSEYYDNTEQVKD